MPQLTWANTTLATVALVRGRCSDIGLIVQKGSSPLNIDTIIQNGIETSDGVDDAKNDLKKHLYLWAKDKYPSTVEKWQNLVGYNFGRYRDRFDLDKIPPTGAWYYDGGEFLNAGIIPVASLTPPTYYTSTVPVNGTSGTLAGVAANGSRLDYIASTGQQRLYVNRGSQSSPTWDKANYRDALDWILNADVLVEPHICATMRRLSEKGIFSNRTNYQDSANKDFAFASEGYWNNKFLSNLYGERDEKGRTVNPGVLKDLDIAYSGDGIMSDFEMTLSGDEHFGFA